MINTQPPAQFDWATELSDAQGHVTLSKQEAKEIGARLRSMGAKLKTYEDLGDAGSDVQLLRMGYAAARLEIESLRAARAIPPDGWLQDRGLLYRLTDERHPCNRDEINVTMVDGSRSDEARARRAGELLYCIRAMRAAQPAGAQQPGAAGLIGALEDAQRAINGMKVEAETAAQGDEQMMLEACETISSDGLQADMAIRAALASHGQAPAQASPAAVAGPSGYGPKATVKRSCSDCKACNSESYAVQGDSGHYVYCEHPSLPESKYIGDTNWNTPHWCPVAAPTTQPAPYEIINMAREQGLPETETEGVFRVNVDDLGRIFASYRAARAPADSVTAPAAYSGNIEQELAMLIRRIVSSARRNCEDGSNVLKLANEAWVYLVRKGLNGSPLRDAGIESDPTPAAQAADSVLEDAGGANWQDISTAPKDGTRFVAVGNNYGLYSEMQHTCIAQWLAGCWVEVSDWNEASELKYLTHWMPLPPLPGSAARAPADSVTASSWASHEKELEDALRERDESDEFIDTLLDEVLGADRAEWSSAYGRADALNDVQERMTTLHKPAVDKAWGRFQVAMATDSVLEDAARLDWLLLRISGAEFRRIGVHYSGNASRADVDAARKQGANHD